MSTPSRRVGLHARWVPLVAFLLAWWAIGLHVIPWLESRDLAAGDPPPPYPMHVLVVEAPARIVAVPYEGLDAHLDAHPDAVLTLPDTGELPIGEFDAVTWRVLERAPDGDLVELAHRSDDYTLTVRYRVVERRATMLHAHLRYVGYFVGALPYAVAVGIVVELLQLWWRRRRRRNA